MGTLSISALEVEGRAVWGKIWIKNLLLKGNVKVRAQVECRTVADKTKYY